MHDVFDSAGFAAVIEYRATPESLSSISTVPVVMTLPGFSVWLENAENTPAPAIQATTPRSRAVRRTFDRLLMRPTFLRAVALIAVFGYGPCIGSERQNWV